MSLHAPLEQQPSQKKQASDKSNASSDTAGHASTPTPQQTIIQNSPRNTRTAQLQKTIRRNTKETVQRNPEAVTRLGSQMEPSRPTPELAALLDKHGVNLEQFVRQHEDDHHAAAAAHEYKEARGDRGAADLTMLRSLAAYSLLQEKGQTASMIGGAEIPMDPELLHIMNLAQANSEEIAAQYGLKEKHVTAIKHYTNSGTNRHMEESFGSAEKGWRILSRALRKIPSTGELGLHHSGLRTPRTAEIPLVTALRPGDIIHHGREKMTKGQKHHMSVSTSYSIFSAAGKVGTAGGLMNVVGHSGKFINPFSAQGAATDGGEVLYPPDVFTRYHGSIEDTGGTGLQMPVLHEVGEPMVPTTVHDDHGYEAVRYPPASPASSSTAAGSSTAPPPAAAAPSPLPAQLPEENDPRQPLLPPGAAHRTYGTFS